MNTTIDLMLLASIAGAGIFIGLATVLAILLILKPRGSNRHTVPQADAESTPESTPDTTAGRGRRALAVLIGGVLLLSLGLPAALLALSPGEAPPAADTVSPPPMASTEPSANITPPAVPEAPPPTPAAPEPDPKPTATPEPAAPDYFVVSNLKLTPDPDSGHNWYRVSVNVANTGSTADSLLLTAKAGDRTVTPQQITLGAGDNVTLELNSLAREIGFLATMYENGVSTQRRHEVIVQNFRETLVFDYPLRLESADTGKIIQPDWEILSRDIGDVEMIIDTGYIYTHRMNWQITLRSNTEPHRIFTITLTLLDAKGDIILQKASENNELPRWDTQTFSGFVNLREEEKERLAGYRINVLCTSGCGEPAE